MKKVLISIIYILIILSTAGCDNNPVPSEYRCIRISDRTTLSDFNVVDNWIFYTVSDNSFDSMISGKILYKINTYDMLPVLIYKNSISDFIADENYIYMTVQSDNGSVLIIRIDHNGENEQELFSGSIYDKPILHNDYLYFSLWDRGFAKIKIDGSEFSVINEKSPYMPFFYDDKIYGFYNLDTWTLCYFTEANPSLIEINTCIPGSIITESNKFLLYR